MGIADGRLKILAFLVEDRLDFFLQTIFLGADFSTQRKQWTTQHTAEFFFDFRLKTTAVLAIFAKAFQGRDSRREERVEFGTSEFPLRVDCGRGKVRLRVKEIIKASLFDPRLLADLIDCGAAIRARPDQIPDGFHQSLFGITDAAHKTFLFSISVRFFNEHADSLWH